MLRKGMVGLIPALIAGLWIAGVYGQEWNGGFPNDAGLRPGIPITALQLQGGYNDQSTHSHRRGWHFNLYSVKAPIAWHISRGTSSTVIAAEDHFNFPFDRHPDLHVKRMAGTTGNWIHVTAASLGDGRFETLGLRGDHGLYTLPVAIAEGNNDNRPEIPGAGMIGVCWGCNGIAVQSGRAGRLQYTDTDLRANGELSLPAVLNVSLGASSVGTGSGREVYKRLIDAGIVVVSAAANDRSRWGERRNEVVNEHDAVVVYPEVQYPGALAWHDALDTANPALDYRVICVSATKDGEVWCTATPCSNTGQSDCLYNRGWTWRGPEQFHDNWNFSPGREKFPVYPDPGKRIAAREAAMVDLCAPGRSILVPNEAPPEDIGHRRKYELISGTSHSAPTVAGIIGQMLSVDRWAGVRLHFDTAGNLLNGRDVQRRVYDILTFTADKIPDFDNIRKDSYARDAKGTPLFYARTDGAGLPIQFDYVLQLNDPLRRTWAQRTGFGKANAYRAVAHAIPHKGRQRYEQSTRAILEFDPAVHNENGTLLMHMGAWYREGMSEDRNANGRSGDVLSVLEYGGGSLPGEKHNNQGHSEINGRGTELVVPAGSLLAVDGMLTSNSTNGNNRIVTEGSGAILLGGYIRDVRIAGNTGISDCIIDGADAGNGCLWVGDAGARAEVFGIVRCTNNGKVVINQGGLLMRPGAEIILDGAEDLLIGGGGSLEMLYGSAIRRGGAGRGRVVRVQAGSLLLVRENAHVNIGCPVIIEAGAEMRIASGAVVNLERFTIETGATLHVQAGAHLALGDGKHYCAGFLYIAGTETKQARITGRFPETEWDVARVTCAGITSWAYITAQGNIARPDGGAIGIRHATFGNVALRISDMAVSTLANTAFTSTRNFTGFPEALLEFHSSRQPGGMRQESAPGDVIVSKCRFAFVDMLPADRAREVQAHDRQGIRAVGLNRLHVQHSEFRFLGNGIHSVRTDTLVAENNTLHRVHSLLGVEGENTRVTESGTELFKGKPGRKN